MAEQPISHKDRLGWVLTGLLYAAGMVLLLRGWLVVPHRTLGDDGDGTIAIAILEHWLQVFEGQAADWMTPRWFWPAPHPLALTDTLFLMALPYAVARGLGAGVFAAYDAVLATLATIGFWSFVALVRRGGVPVVIAAVFAFVFSFGAVPLFKTFHAQTYTLQLAPILGLLLVWAWRGPAWPAAAAGVLFGLMTFTAAQTPWFLGLEAGLAVVLGVALAPGGWAAAWAAQGRIVGRIVGRGAAFGAGLVLGLVPFGLLYRHSLGLVRTWDEVLSFSPNKRDLFHFPPGNWLWSPLAERLGLFEPRWIDMETALGPTPALLASAVAALVLGRWLIRQAGARPGDGVMLGCLAAGLLGPMAAINYGPFDPWYLVFKLVPAGHSVRTPFRIELAAQFLLCIGLALAATRVVLAAGRWHRPGVGVALGVWLALVLVEQGGAPPTTRDTAADERWLSALRRPDFACGAFYLVPKPGEWWVYQSDAMLAAQMLQMPTLNGNNSFYPQGWALRLPDSAGYPGNVRQWVAAHGLEGQVCGADPRAGRWEAGLTAVP